MKRDRAFSDRLSRFNPLFSSWSFVHTDQAAAEFLLHKQTLRLRQPCFLKHTFTSANTNALPWDRFYRIQFVIQYSWSCLSGCARLGKQRVSQEGRFTETGLILWVTRLRCHICVYQAELLHKVVRDFLCAPSRPEGKQLDSNDLMGIGLYARVSEIPGVTDVVTQEVGPA